MDKNRLVYIFILVLFVFGFWGLDSNAQLREEFFTVKDLKSEWLVYDQSSSLFLPYIKSVNKEARIIHFNLDLNFYADSYIQLTIPANTGFFIDNKLVDFTGVTVTKTYSIDSLSTIFLVDNVFISIYTKSDIDKLDTRIVTPQQAVYLSSSDQMFLPIEKLPQIKIFEFIKIAVILILILYAFLLNSGRRIFFDYYNISNSFSRVSIDEFLDRTAKLSRIDITYIVGLSIVMSFSILLIIYNKDVRLDYKKINSIIKPISTWGLLAILLFIWYMLRLFIISLVSDIFKLREIKVIHTFELIRLTNFLSILFFAMVVLTLFIFKMRFDILGLILSQSILGFAAFRLIVFFIKFLNSTTYKKFYLFAYLCTAELIPILVGLKILLKSSFLLNII